MNLNLIYGLKDLFFTLFFNNLNNNIIDFFLSFKVLNIKLDLDKLSKGITDYYTNAQSELYTNLNLNSITHQYMFFSCAFIFFVVLTVLFTVFLRKELFILLVIIEILYLILFVHMIVLPKINTQTAIIICIMIISLAACETALGLAILISQLQHILEKDKK